MALKLELLERAINVHTRTVIAVTKHSPAARGRDQRELFDASFAVASGVAGGIPAVLKLVGVLAAPREALTAARP